MGSVYKPTFTKPLPESAEVLTRKGERVARWTDGRGRKHTGTLTHGQDGSPRVLVETHTYTAKYRDGAGLVRKVATGCRTLDAARSVLAELETRADKVRSGLRTAADDAVLDYQASGIAEHTAAYLSHLCRKRGKGGRARVSAAHCANVKHCLGRIVAECGFKRLRDLNRSALERWADKREADGMGARTINTHLAALTAFGNWCVENGRLAVNPFVRPPKRDEHADARHARRALTADELRRLLKTARLRPLAEYGRPTVKLADAEQRTDKRSRRTWKRAPLSFDALGTATANAREALAERPGFIAKLETLGRERALVYKTLVLTGLRKGELAALTVGHATLDQRTAYLTLDAADAKSGQRADIPLRGDLAADLSEHLAERLRVAQRAAKAASLPIPARLPPAAKLIHVPAALSKVMNRDLEAAGIAKRDDRGRVVDVHALRHTFGTHLSKGGVAPRTAQAAMRHSSLDLTMNIYTDPRLLDVAGALDALPALPLDDDRDTARRATGTDPTSLVPMLVPTTGKTCTNVASADKTAEPQTRAATCVSDTADTTKTHKSSAGQKRATRLERATISLEG